MVWFTFVAAYDPVGWTCPELHADALDRAILIYADLHVEHADGDSCVMRIKLCKL